MLAKVGGRVYDDPPSSLSLYRWERIGRSVKDDDVDCGWMPLVWRSIAGGEF